MTIRTIQLDRIITSAPLNKTAAVVTSASRASIAASEAQERRADLVKALLRTEAMIVAAATKEEKKALGVKKLDLQNQIKALKAIRKRPGIDSCFMTAARELLTKPMYNIIRNRAAQIYDAEQADAEGQS